MHEAVVEASLDGDGFILTDESAIVAGDEAPPTRVLLVEDDEDLSGRIAAVLRSEMATLTV